MSIVVLASFTISMGEGKLITGAPVSARWVLKSVYGWSERN